MRTCHVVTSVSRAAAGVSKAVLELAEALANHGHSGRIVALEDEFTAQDLPSIPLPVNICRRDFSARWTFSFSLRWQIGRRNETEVIHSHGLWLYPNWAAASAARACHIPHIVSPHGMLEPWALERSALKKKLVWHLFQGGALRQARVLHATALKEAQQFRSLGLRNPIAVIPNGVNVPDRAKNWESPQEKKTLLFLSRIHPIKGLLNLVQAWKILKPEGWHAIIAGPDEGGHLAQVKRSVKEANLDSCFEFTGPVYGEQKWDLYRSTDVFVLPSYSENFGIVIAEALAAEVPVITTTATPWQELVTHDCGWWVDVGVEPLVAGLREAISLTDEERRDMGKRGRKLVENSYSWAKIAADMTNVYEWIQGGGNPPPCVMTD